MTRSVKKSSYAIHKAAVYALVIGYTLYLLIFSDRAKAAAISGLGLCADVILTTVFPFAVASELMASSGICDTLGKYVGAPLRHMFGLSPAGAGIMLLGLIGGYPTGASRSAQMYKDGVLSKSEAQALISYTNNATPAFMLSCAKDSKTGAFLYVVCIFSSFFWAFIVRGSVKKLDSESVTDAGGVSLSSAVVKCVTPALNICAFIIIFSILSSVTETLPTFGGITAAVSALFEITTGISRLNALNVSGRIASSAVCAAASFSGLCVGSQVKSVANSAGLSTRLYFAGKLFQAVTSFFTVYLMYPVILS